MMFMKRRHPDSEGPVIQEKRTKLDAQKNPVSQLYEVFPSITVKFNDKGTPQQPNFQACCTVNEQLFESSGTSKQKAKYNLALNILHYYGLIDSTMRNQVGSTFKDYSEIRSNFSYTTSEDDYEKSNIPLQQHHFISSEIPFMQSTAYYHREDASEVSQMYQREFLANQSIDVDKVRNHPAMMLSEIFPKLDISWMEGSGRGDHQFRAEAEIHDKTFFGEGRSKKLAKTNLAKSIFMCLYNIQDFSDCLETSIKQNKNDLSKNDEANPEKMFPLAQLKNLVGGDINFEIVKQEPLPDSNEPVYHATVVVEGVAYEAIGNSKSLAKLRATKKVLGVINPKKGDSFGQIDTSRHPNTVFNELYQGINFEESKVKGLNGLSEFHVEAEIEGKLYKSKAQSKKKAKLRVILKAFQELNGISPADWTAIDFKDVDEEKETGLIQAHQPIVLLNKLNPLVKYTVTESNLEGAKKFKAIAYIGDHEFMGEGTSKKTAKTTAARISLKVLFGIDSESYKETTETVITEPKNEIPGEMSDAIADAVQNQFSALLQDETQTKVIAGFVLCSYEDGNVAPKLKVISIGTGTKCISGEQIGQKGEILNDCHGEIIACRGFRQYLYDELIKALQMKPDVIFNKKANGKYVLKSTIKIYLYINTAPCGDGRVFSIQTQKNAKNKTAGMLRTKIENGQGTIPVPENNIQTSDGILEGERLRTMSCSDKLLKWNALGVQGAILSLFIEPVYLQGVVIGLHYDYDALHRALFKRAANIQNCPQPYRLNSPSLGTPSNNETIRDTSKATSNSFNWYYGQNTVEAVNSITGQTIIQTPSRLCKLAFFDKLQLVISLCSNSITVQTYHNAKMLAKEYQLTKQYFFKALKESLCGKWIGKPYEHDMFGY